MIVERREWGAFVRLHLSGDERHRRDALDEAEEGYRAAGAGDRPPEAPAPPGAAREVAGDAQDRQEAAELEHDAPGLRPVGRTGQSGERRGDGVEALERRVVAPVGVEG